MKKLPIPEELSDDSNATEMIRLWIDKNNVHISMLVGEFEDSQNPEINEKDVWGELLAKLIKHISNSMFDKYGFVKEETEKTIVYSLLHRLQIRVNNTIEGQ